MSRQTNLAACCAACVLGFTVVRLALGQDAPTLWVMNNGVDSHACGAAETPCRSISRAILNAAPGSTIWVGPGYYGDVDRDGSYDDPGDEGPLVAGRGLVHIDKPLRIYSTHGSAVTTIDARPGELAPPGGIVQIASSNVHFGSLGNGFTVAGLPGSRWSNERPNGIALFSPDNSVIYRSVRISGNALQNVSRGILLYAWTTWLVVSDNVSTGNLEGFHIQSYGWRGDGRPLGPTRFTRNVARSNAGDGVLMFAMRATVHRNVLEGNGNSGAWLVGTRFRVENNAFLNNRLQGATMAPQLPRDVPILTFVGNTAIGNNYSGVQITRLPAVFFERNNIWANGTALSERSNCGLYAYLLTTAQVAPNNYWGSPSGPGPDPADDAGQNGAPCATVPTVVTPYATQPFPIVP